MWCSRESLGFVSERHLTLPFPGCAIVDGPSVPLIQLIETQLRNPNRNNSSMAHINRKFRVMTCLCLSFSPFALCHSHSHSQHCFSLYLHLLGWSGDTPCLSWQALSALAEVTNWPCVRKTEKAISSSPGEHREGQLQFTKARGIEKTKNRWFYLLCSYHFISYKMGLRFIL